MLTTEKTEKTAATARMLSLNQFIKAFWLVVRQLAPIGALCLVLLAMLQLVYLRNPTRTDNLRRLSIDHFIVLEQINRASSVPAPKIAFLGDSSCLMGVYPRAIEQALNLRPVESFCSIGYLGPAGYAMMLDGMIQRGAAPQSVVVMLHPVTFERQPSWDSWTAFARQANQPQPARSSFPRGALDYLKFGLIDRFVYTPLPGLYGLYYGGEFALRNVIARTGGSAIDPATGLHAGSAEALRAQPRPFSGKAAEFTDSQAFRDALAVLRASLRKLPRQTQVYVFISPLPDYEISTEAAIARRAREEELADLLGIPADHILKTPATMYAEYFSGRTHLNRWGQRVFTDELVKALSRAIQRSPAE